LSGSVSPLPWTGSKGCIYTIDAFMPPHKTYVEACMGSAEVFLRKKPAEREIINDYNGDLVKFFRVLQQNEKLAYLLGRLYLSFNSEELFRINKVMLADVPNILDDLTETSVTVEKAEWSDIEKAVAFFENQIFSFSSTGKTFAIAKKDMTKRFGRLVTACSRLRNAVIMHRDYKDCISYEELEEVSYTCGRPENLSKEVRSVFCHEDDEPYDPYLHIDTYKDFYSRSMFLVNYGKSVKGRVKKDKPTRYRGYASKVSIAAFEIDEYDTIGYWLTPEEYEKLSDKEKQKYSYYEWDEYDDWYRVYNLIVDRVDTMLGYFCRWAEYAIKDANPDEICPTADYVRLLVYRC